MSNQSLTRTERYVLGKIAAWSVKASHTVFTVVPLPARYNPIIERLKTLDLLSQHETGGVYITPSGVKEMLMWPRSARPVRAEVLNSYVARYDDFRGSHEAKRGRS